MSTRDLRECKRAQTASLDHVTIPSPAGPSDPEGKNVFAENLRQAVEAAPRDRLSELSAALWKAFAGGAVTEAEAESLSNLIEARKALAQDQRTTGAQSVGAILKRPGIFPARRH